MNRLGLSGLPARCLTVAVGVAIVIAAGCSDIPSDPKTPFSIEFNRAPSPSVVLGDTLFDSAGFVKPLRAIVYNSKGEEIVGAPVTYRVVAYDSVARTDPTFKDSVPLTVDPATGYVLGKDARVYAGKTARVYAQSGALQSQTVVVTATRRADTLVAVGAVLDTLVLRFANVESLTVAPGPSVGVRHKPLPPETSAEDAVPAYLVRFHITQPNGADTDTSYVMLTSGDRKRSEIDTTDASGNASRQIRIRRVNFPFSKPATNDTIYDTVIVKTSAVRRGGVPVPGSGLEFRLIIKARKQ